MPLRLAGRACLVAAAALLVACQPPQTPPPKPPEEAPPKIEGDLGALKTQAAQQGGVVRIIARLATPAEPAAMAEVQSTAMAAMTAAGVVNVAALSEELPLVVAEVTPEQLDALAATGQVDAVMEDRLAFPSLRETIPIVQAREAWTLGSRGAGVAVAILDTGVDAAHPLLTPRVVAEACFSSNSAAAGARSLCASGATSQTGTGAGKPCTGAPGCDHGTHVAGIAAARSAQRNGVAPDADIIAVQVFSLFTNRPGGPQPCGPGATTCIASFTSDQIRGLDFVRRQAAGRKVAAANMSLGGGRFTAACDTDITKGVIDQLRAVGVSTVIASGNDGFSNAVSAPGCISTAVTVGATQDNDRLAAFSNRGPQVDMLAPGVNVVSAVPGGATASFSGTSMATPHVAGAITLVKALRPAATIDQIERVLAQTGRPVGGKPRMRIRDAVRALDALLAPPTPGVAAVASTPDAPATPPVVAAAMDTPPKALSAAIDALPAGAPARVMVKAHSAEPADLESVAAAARAAGATTAEPIPGQPVVVVEATPEQLRVLAADASVAGMQQDVPAKTQAKP
jgi:subtilisin family serine protease